MTEIKKDNTSIAFIDNIDIHLYCDIRDTSNDIEIRKCDRYGDFRVWITKEEAIELIKHLKDVYEI